MGIAARLIQMFRKMAIMDASARINALKLCGY